ncbi:MAG: type I phosphomannose isomerase catalytic subunit [Fervidobacterium sp.]
MTIKILPEFRPMIWGNFELNRVFGVSAENPIGEVWLLSGHPLYENVLDTKETINEFGKKIYNGRYKRFPILIKLVSTSQWLSVQVHPDDEYAKKVENEPWGKSEVWYFLTDGELAICEEVGILSELAEHGEFNKLPRYLTFVKIKSGTFVNIPAGTVHALGPNSTVIEVQQSSDLTYRIYDWGRPRETHIQKAISVAKNIKVSEIVFENTYKLSNGYFTMHVLTDERNFPKEARFPIVRIPLKLSREFCASISFEENFSPNGILIYNFL